MLKLARTINQVHERKVAHLDMKIPNVMVDTATGVWILIDFGLAKTDAQPEHFQQDVADFCSYIVHLLLHRDEASRAFILSETAKCKDFDGIAAVFNRFMKNAP
jgi:tRNA A-37 threonylcarbamoyl transferase component Bud32